MRSTRIRRTGRADCSWSCRAEVGRIPADRPSTFPRWRILAAASILILASVAPARAELVFRQGDCNLDERYNIVDAIRLLSFLFDGKVATVCHTACDTNRDGELSILDALKLLYHVFQGDPLPGNPTVPLTAVEICGDAIDNDCNDEIDEGCDVVGVSSVTLAWNPVSRDVDGQPIAVDGYEVAFGTASRRYTASRLAGRSTEITIQGLELGVTYYFAVRAYRGGLRSGWSAELPVTLFP